MSAEMQDIIVILGEIFGLFFEHEVCLKIASRWYGINVLVEKYPPPLTDTADVLFNILVMNNLV